MRLNSFLFKALSLTLLTCSALAASPGADPDADYDRLDGTGTSGRTVHVIEWEGNLEVHVSPQGSLKGLALKIDRKNKDRPVMVIGYRFNGDPKTQLVRRAILGIPLTDAFKVYRDLTADDYDKIIISNNGLALSKTLTEFKLEAEPKQLYPDGHPALANTSEKTRTPAAKKSPDQDRAGQSGIETAPQPEEGRIQPFGM